MTLKINNETYKGTGNSKKKAKVIAAAACLEEKVGHCQYNTVAMVGHAFKYCVEKPDFNKSCYFLR